MNLIKFFLVVFAVILLMLSTNTAKALQGEPVPGAEIYIELEPDDEPIINGGTNSNGEFEGIFTVTNPTPPKPRSIKVSFKVPENIWKKIADKYKQTKFFGKYEFQLVIMTGKRKFEKNVKLEINNNSDVKNLSIRPSGPFSQSLSNIEDGKLIGPNNPGKIPVKIILLMIKAPFGSVNNYGINDEGIK